MRQLLLAAAVLLFLPTLATAQSVAGTYDVIGTNFDGSVYEGLAQIVVTSDTTCEIVWETAGETSSGICMRNENALAAGYVLGDAIGLIIYQIMDDGSLEGLWTLAGERGHGTELLMPR